MTEEEILKRAEEIQKRNSRLQKLERALKADTLRISFADHSDMEFNSIKSVSVSRFMLESAIRAEIERIKKES